MTGMETNKAGILGFDRGGASRGRQGREGIVSWKGKAEHREAEHRERER